MKTITKTLTVLSFILLIISNKGFTQTLFQKAYNQGLPSDYSYSQSITKIDNNKFVMAGYESSPLTNDAYLACIDSLGSVIWSNKYGDAGFSSDEFAVTKYTFDGNIVSAGQTYSGPGGSRDCYIIKTDINGSLIWAKAFGSSSFEQIQTIAEDAFGNIYCAGSGGGLGFIVKLDGAGNLIWQKQYSTIGNVLFYSLISLPSGDLMVTGLTYYSGLNHGLLLKLDSNGIISWSKSYVNSTDQSFNKVIALPNNEFAVSGLSDLYPSSSQSITKTDFLGNIIWSKRSGYTSTTASSLFLTPDSNAIYVTGGHNILFPYRQANLSKFSLSGNLLWEKEYGGCGENFFWDMSFSSSSLYLAGITRSYGVGNTSSLLVRADTSGYTSCYDNFTSPSYYDQSLTTDALTFTTSIASFAYSTHTTNVNSIVLYDSLICSSKNPVGVRFHSNDTVICAGSCISFFNDNTVMHNGYNPTSGLHFKWIFPGATFPSGADELENPTNICYATAGQHDVRLIVTDGCKIDTLIKEKYILVTDASPELNFSGDSSLCGGGIAQLVVSGAKTYSWSPTTGLDNPTNDTIIATPTQTTTYTVTGSLGGSCIGTKDVTVTVGNAVMSDAGANDTICSGESATLIGSGGQTFTWSSNQITRTIIVSPVTTTDYIFTAIDGSCDDTDTVEVFVKETPIVTITPENTEVEQGSTVNLEASSGGTYSWSPSIGLSCDTCATTIATPLSSTNYCVTVTSTNGCEADKCVNITVTYNCGELFVPNSFSPNGDNINDKLEVKINPACISEYSLQIFDRWGELVFEATKITDLWDGKFDGKELDNATFVYYLKVKLINSQNSIIKKGNINLIR